MTGQGVVHALLSSGAKGDLLDDEGSTPLFTACCNGHAEVARAQLSAGAKVDLQNLDGGSPLFMACQGAMQRWSVPYCLPGPRLTS